jgi:hypothetical protein
MDGWMLYFERGQEKEEEWFCWFDWGVWGKP